MKKYILFDFDGVIANSFEPAFKINTKLRPGVTAQEYRDYFNGNIYDALALKNKKPLSNDSVKSFFDYYKSELVHISCIDGMSEVIQTLSRDYELIIVSSTIGNLIEEFLQQHNLQKYFLSVMGAEIESNKSKKIQMIFDDFNITASDCIFITDTLGDIKEARVAGVDAIAVSWGYHSLATLELGSPLVIADKPSELPSLVRTFLS